MNEKTLIKWYEAKEKLNKLEEKIKKYKSQISKEMNKEEVDKLTFGEFSVTRRRNTRESLSKTTKMSPTVRINFICFLQLS